MRTKPGQVVVNVYFAAEERNALKIAAIRAGKPLAQHVREKALVGLEVEPENEATA